jgi:hypothetical protein
VSRVLIECHLDEKSISLDSRAVGNVVREGTYGKSSNSSCFFYDRDPLNRSILGIVEHHVSSRSTNVLVTVLITDRVSDIIEFLSYRSAISDTHRSQSW